MSRKRQSIRAAIGKDAGRLRPEIPLHPEPVPCAEIFFASVLLLLRHCLPLARPRLRARRQLPWVPIAMHMAVSVPLGTRGVNTPGAANALGNSRSKRVLRPWRSTSSTTARVERSTDPKSRIAPKARASSRVIARNSVRNPYEILEK